MSYVLVTFFIFQALLASSIIGTTMRHAHANTGYFGKQYLPTWGQVWLPVWLLLSILINIWFICITL